MLYRAVRSYSIRNLFINGEIIQSREISYKTYKKSNNIYVIRKNNAKRKKLRKFYS